MNGFLAAVTQRGFFSETKIRDVVLGRLLKELRSLYPTLAGRDPGISRVDLRAALIFMEEKQRTWLVIWRDLVFAVLDDRQWEEATVLWRQKREDVLPVETAGSVSDLVGVLRFGGRKKELLYSKELFLNDPVVDAVTRFLHLEITAPLQAANA